MHDHAEELVVGGVVGDQRFVDLGLDGFAQSDHVAPGHGLLIAVRVESGLFQKVGAKVETSGTCVKGNAVNFSLFAHDADLIGGKLVVVNASGLQVGEDSGVVGDEALDLEVLEQSDVGKTRAARLKTGFDLSFDSLGNVDNFNSDIGMSLVVDGGRLFHGVPVEVRVPTPDCDLLGLCRGQTSSTDEQRRRHQDRKNLFHIPSYGILFSLSPVVQNR